MLDIAACAGDEIVQAENVVACARSRSHRWEPRKPAPLATRIRFPELISRSDPDQLSALTTTGPCRQAKAEDEMIVNGGAQ
jgi:hypothetical protein